MVKKTVNQDDPTVYHLFYADENGSAGADITFFEYPGAIPGRAGDGMVHRVALPRRQRGVARLLAGARRRRAHRRLARLRRPGGSRARARRRRRRRRAARRAPSRDPRGARACAASPACAPTRRRPRAARDFLEGLTFDGSGAEWESRGDRHGFYVYDEPPDDRRGIPGAGTVHHVAWSVPLDEHAGWVEKARGGGRTPDAGDRPLLVPLDLLPRAERHPVRDRVARPRLHHRRGPRAPRREADPAAGLRAPARAGRAAADAAAEPRAGDRPRAPRERRAGGRARPLPRARRRRARPLPAARRARPGAPPRRLHARAGRSRCRPAARTGTSSPRVGYPDPETFNASYREASDWLDSLPHERLVLGGFSQGCVMSLALGLGTGRPRPVAIAGFSGFIPVVEGWQPDLERPLPPVALGHGTYDPVIDVSFGRTARDTLLAAGGEVLYKEYPLPHTLQPRSRRRAPGGLPRGVDRPRDRPAVRHRAPPLAQGRRRRLRPGSRAPGAASESRRLRRRARSARRGPPSDSPTRVEAVPLVERRPPASRPRPTARPPRGRASRAFASSASSSSCPSPCRRRDGTIEIVTSGVCSSTNP